MMKCERCEKPSDGWPGEGKDAELCQMCWEAYCSEMWWEYWRAGSVEGKGAAGRTETV
jgi:hypothetical protein